MVDARHEGEAGALVPCETAKGDGPPAERHDAFNGARKRVFLKVLAKTGCRRDAARKAGISPQTAYNHQHADAQFARQCELALGIAASDAELVAWERGVVGIEEEVISYGKVVGTRIRRSDSILRLLLQGANRKKYGPRPGFSRKRLLKHERKEIEREIRAKIAAEAPDPDQLAEKLVRRIKKAIEHQNEARLAAGWVEIADTVWIPPGWVREEDGSREPRGELLDLPEVLDSV